MLGPTPTTPRPSLAVAVAVAVALTVAVTASALHVDCAGGSDAPWCGNTTHPCLTLGHALALAPPTGATTLTLAPGTCTVAAAPLVLNPHAAAQITIQGSPTTLACPPAPAPTPACLVHSAAAPATLVLADLTLAAAPLDLAAASSSSLSRIAFATASCLTATAPASLALADSSFASSCAPFAPPIAIVGPMSASWSGLTVSAPSTTAPAVVLSTAAALTITSSVFTDVAALAAVSGGATFVLTASSATSFTSSTPPLACSSAGAILVSDTLLCGLASAPPHLSCSGSCVTAVNGAPSCTITPCPGDCAPCSGPTAGSCNAAAGTCTCNPGFFGPACAVTAYPATVTGLAPSAGSVAGGTVLTLTGTAFASLSSDPADLALSFSPAGVACTPTTLTNTTLTCTTPVIAGAPLAYGANTLTLTHLPTGLTAACAPLFPLTACEFHYGPEITAIAPTRVYIGGGDPVRLSGIGFPPSGAVYNITIATPLGPVDCPITTPPPTDTTVYCAPPPFVSEGFFSLSALADGFPVSCAACAIEVVLSEVTAVAPPIISAHDGAVLTLTGSGFVPGHPGAHTIVIGGSAPCPVLATPPPTATSLTCLAPPFAAGPTSLTLTVAAHAVPAVCLGSDCAFAYASILTALTPPAVSMEGGATITLAGLVFDASTLASTAISLGGATCTPLLVTSTSARCSLNPVGAPGTFALAHATRGVASFCNASTPSGGCTLDVLPYTTTVDPSRGSISGGTMLTVRGYGFGSPASANSVTVGGVPCVVTWVSGNGRQLRCVTSAHPPSLGTPLALNATHAATSYPAVTDLTHDYVSDIATHAPASGTAAGATRITLTGIGYGISPGNVAITLAPSGTDCVLDAATLSDTYLECVTNPVATGTAAAQTILLSVQGVAAVCTSPDACAFTFEPEITSVTPAVGSVAGSTPITIAGYGFAVAPLTANVIGIDGAVCSVTAATFSTIECTTSAHPLHASPLAIDLVVASIARTPCTTSCSYSYRPAVTGLATLSPHGVVASGAPVAYSSITVTGVGFGTDASSLTLALLPSGLPCTVVPTSVSDTSLVCTTPPHAPALVAIALNRSAPHAPALCVGAACALTVAPHITALAPTSTTISSLSTPLTISGAGLDVASPSSPICTPVASATYTSLSCTAGPSPSATAGTHALSLSFTSFTAICTAPSCSLSYHPELAAVAPATTSVATPDPLVLSGAGFNPTTLSANAVLVNGVACLPTSASTSSLTCALAAAPPDVGGPYAPSLTVSGLAPLASFPASAGTAFVPHITALAPTSTRVGGGTSLVLGGAGFGSSVGNLDVVLDVDGTPTPCIVTAAAPSSVTCTTPSVPLPLVASLAVTRVNGSSSYVAVCTAPTCALTYRPTISALAPTSLATTTASTAAVNVTITGTGFHASSDLALTFSSPAASSPCAHLVVVSSTTAVCTTAPPLVPSAVSATLTATLTAASPVSIPSICTAAACSVAIHPEVFTVAPRTSPLVPLAALTVTGAGFVPSPLTSNVVTVYGAACPVTAATTSTIVCTLPSASSIGTRTIAVTAASLATARCNNCSLTYTPHITSLSPTSGLVTGGQAVTIAGSGFSTTPSSHTITLSGVACSPISAAPDGSSVTCVTDSVATRTAGVPSVLVDATPAPPLFATFDSSDPALRFSFNAAVSSISPTSLQASAFAAGAATLSIAGSGFDAGAPASHTITIGTVGTCTPTFASLTLLVCTLTPTTATPPPEATAYVVVVTLGGVDSLCSLNPVSAACRTLTLTPTYSPPLAPTRGPSSGGTDLVITGAGFPSSSPASILVTFGGLSCTVTDVSATSVTCTTPVHPRGIATPVITSRGLNAPCTGTPSACAFTFAPRLDAALPLTASLAGGDTLSITGVGFSPTTTDNVVTVGGLACPVLTSTPTALTCTVPRATGNNVVTVAINVTVDGVAALAVPAHTLTYSPFITAILPASVTLAGGEVVTLTGGGFTPPLAISFGGGPCTSPTPSPNRTTVTCTTSAAPLGIARSLAVTLTASNLAVPAVCAAATPPCAVRFDGTVAAISPVRGTAAGGTTVTLTGAGFDSATAASNVVTLDGVPCTLAGALPSTTSLECVTGAHAPGNTTAVVTVNGGLLVALSPMVFEYAPAVTGVAPLFGSLNGGTTLTITGTAFGTDDTVIGVTIGPAQTRCDVVAGSATGSSFSCVTRTAAPGSNLAVNVRVVSQLAVCLPTTACSYSYVGPEVGAVSPPFAGVTGGTTLTLSGVRFLTGDGAVRVTVAGVDCPLLGSASNTTANCTLPASAGLALGSADVRLYSGSLAAVCATTAACTITRVPVVSSVLPPVGSVLGGTSVTVTGAGLGPATVVTIDATPCPLTPGTATATSVICVPTGLAVGRYTSVVASNPDAAVCQPPSACSYEVLPALSGVSPAFAPVTGGVEVALAGSGFSSLATQLNVTLGGYPCTVGSSSPSSILCTTAAVPRSAATGPVSISVLRAGSSAPAVGAPALPAFRFTAAISGVAPLLLPVVGGTLTISGAAFAAPIAVALLPGPIACASPVVSASGHEVECAVSGPVAGGVYTVDIDSAGAPAACASASACTIRVRSLTSAIEPAFVSVVGGDEVTLTGAGFATVNPSVANAVEIDGVACNVTGLVSSSSLVCVVAPHARGSVTVTVAVGGEAALCAPSVCSLSYVPAIVGVSPTFGPLTAGTVVTVTGAGFRLGASAADFGVSQGSVTEYNSGAGRLVVSLAAGAAGVVSLNVTMDGKPVLCPSGCEYEYVAAEIHGVSPALVSVAGGAQVTVSGLGFAPGLGSNVVLIDGVSASVVSASNTSIVCVTPAHAAGVVSVDVSVLGNRALCVLCSLGFRPVVTGITPRRGSWLGGTTLALSGFGFSASLAGNTVVMDGSTCTVSGSPSTTALTCTTSAHALGTVDVELSVGGVAALCATNGTGCGYSFRPIVSAVAPATVTVVGGVELTIAGSGFDAAVPAANVVSVAGVACVLTAPPSASVLTCVAPAWSGAFGGGQGVVEVMVGGNGAVSTCGTGAANLCATQYVPQVESVAPGGVALSGVVALPVVTLTGVGFPVVVADIRVELVGQTSGSVVPCTVTNVGSGGGSVECQPATTLGTVEVVAVNAFVRPLGGGVPSVSVRSVCGSSGSVCTVEARPVVTSLTPSSGPLTGGSDVGVSGAGFAPGNTTVSVDGQAAVSAASGSASGFAVTMPSLTVGRHSVSVGVRVGGRVFAALCATNTSCVYTSVPAITGLSLKVFRASGGTQTTITGSGFRPGDLVGQVVKVNGVVAPLVEAPLASRLVVAVPASALGPGPAVLEYSLPPFGGLCEPATLCTSVAYIDLGVTGVSPDAGPMSGGTEVVVGGFGFVPAVVRVWVGSVECAVNVSASADDRLVCRAGVAAAVGQVDVSIEMGALVVGCDLAGACAWTALPVVDAVSPAESSVRGGRVLEVSGVGFGGVTELVSVAVVVDGSSVGVCEVVPGTVTETSLSCVTPRVGGAGEAQVRVSVRALSAGGASVQTVCAAGKSTCGAVVFADAGCRAAEATTCAGCMAAGGIGSAGGPCVWCPATRACVDGNSAFTICPTAGGGVVAGSGEACPVDPGGPVVVGVAPSAVNVGGGTELVVSGAGFAPGVTVRVWKEGEGGGATMSDVLADADGRPVDGGADNVTVDADGRRVVVVVPPLGRVGYWDLGVSNVGSGGEAVVVDGVYAAVVSCAEPGFYYTGSSCVACGTLRVAGGCPGGRRVWANAGNWKGGEEGVAVASCRPRSRCLGGRWSACADGYEGEVCGTCSEGWFEAGEVCVACDTGTATVVMTFGLAAFVAAVMIGSATVLDDELLDVSVMGMLMLQVIRGVLRMSPAEYPEWFQRYASYWGAVGLEVSILRLRCLFGPVFAASHVEDAIYTSAVYWAVYATPFVGLLVWPRWRNRGIRSLCWLALLTLASGLDLGLSALVCFRDEAGVWRLEAERSRECFGGSHQALALVGSCVLVVYAGVCAWVCLYVATVRAASVSQMERYGIFVEQFKGEHHSFLLAYVVVLVGELAVDHAIVENATMSALCAEVFLFGFLLVIIRKFPFALPWQNYFASLGSAVAQVAVLAGYVAATGSEGEAEMAAVGVAVVASATAVALVAIYAGVVYDRHAGVNRIGVGGSETPDRYASTRAGLSLAREGSDEDGGRRGVPLVRVETPGSDVGSVAELARVSDVADIFVPTPRSSDVSDDVGPGDFAAGARLPGRAVVTAAAGRRGRIRPRPGVRARGKTPPRLGAMGARARAHHKTHDGALTAAEGSGTDAAAGGLSPTSPRVPRLGVRTEVRSRARQRAASRSRSRSRSQSRSRSRLSRSPRQLRPGRHVRRTSIEPGEIVAADGDDAAFDDASHASAWSTEDDNGGDTPLFTVGGVFLRPTTGAPMPVAGGSGSDDASRTSRTSGTSGNTSEKPEGGAEGGAATGPPAGWSRRRASIF